MLLGGPESLAGDLLNRHLPGLGRMHTPVLDRHGWLRKGGAAEGMRGPPVGPWGWAGMCRLSLSMRMGVGVGGVGMGVQRGVLGRGVVGKLEAGPAADGALGSPRPQQLAADVVWGQRVAGVGPQVPQGVLGGPQGAVQGGQALLGLLELLQGVAACAGQVVLHAGSAQQVLGLVRGAGLLRHQQVHHLQHSSQLEPVEGAPKASRCGRVSCGLPDSVQMGPDCRRSLQHSSTPATAEPQPPDQHRCAPHPPRHQCWSTPLRVACQAGTVHTAPIAYPQTRDASEGQGAHLGRGEHAEHAGDVGAGGASVLRHEVLRPGGGPRHACQASALEGGG